MNTQTTRRSPRKLKPLKHLNLSEESKHTKSYYNKKTTIKSQAKTVNKGRPSISTMKTQNTRRSPRKSKLLKHMNLSEESKHRKSYYDKRATKKSQLKIVNFKKGRAYWGKFGERGTKELKSFLIDGVKVYYPKIVGGITRTNKQMRQEGKSGIHYAAGYTALNKFFEQYGDNFEKWPSLRSHTSTQFFRYGSQNSADEISEASDDSDDSSTWGSVSLKREDSHESEDDDEDVTFDTEARKPTLKERIKNLERALRVGVREDLSPKLRVERLMKAVGDEIFDDVVIMITHLESEWLF